MIPAFLPYLTRQDREHFIFLASSLLESEEFNHGLDHAEFISDVKKELEVELMSSLTTETTIRYFNQRPERVKRVVILELAAAFIPHGIHETTIDKLGREIGIGDEISVLMSWAQDYCEFIDTGLMFINGK